VAAYAEARERFRALYPALQPPRLLAEGENAATLPFTGQ
jgi:hypothetical protein